MPDRSVRRRFVMILAALGLSLVVCEAGLEASRVLFPRVRYMVSPPWNRNKIADSRLGYRMSPYFPGHDSRGYRNADALAHYPVVAIGDSFTYGYATAADDAWPAQLSRLTGLPVYNAGVGGYGPCQYSTVAAELAALRPAVVIVGIFVNDPKDAYTSVYGEGLCPEFQSQDPAVLEALRNADAQGTLAQRAAEVGDREVVPAPESLIQRSALYGLARSVLFRLQVGSRGEFDRGAGYTYEMAAVRPFRVVMDRPEPFRTVFLDPRVQELALDMGDPRIAEGARITLASIDAIRSKLGSETVLLIVVFHDKPTVLASVLRNQRPDLWPKFEKLVRLDTALAGFLSDQSALRHITTVDTLPETASAVARGIMLFPATDDHHLEAKGYGVVATALSLLPEIQNLRGSQK